MQPNSSQLIKTDLSLFFTDTGFTISSATELAGHCIFVAITAPEVETLSAEDFAEQKLKFATYENRKMVKCGNDAEAKRDHLIQNLAEDGYNLTEILKYL